MAKLHLDAELAAVVQRARCRAEQMGELPRGPFPKFESRIPSESLESVLEWLRCGGHEEAIAAIGADDPDLANE
ncbi:MAG TPA: hypothetical protein VM142_03255 [Acidimicrobiales bacterium]|nr:hypothetical protein [Acidimicrobiales bacterium]